MAKTVSTVSLSGVSYVDSLLSNLKWSGIALTYSFRTEAPDSKYATGFTECNSAQKTAVREALFNFCGHDRPRGSPSTHCHSLFVSAFAVPPQKKPPRVQGFFGSRSPRRAGALLLLVYALRGRFVKVLRRFPAAGAKRRFRPSASGLHKI